MQIQKNQILQKKLTIKLLQVKKIRAVVLIKLIAKTMIIM